MSSLRCKIDRQTVTIARLAEPTVSVERDAANRSRVLARLARLCYRVLTMED